MNVAKVVWRNAQWIIDEDGDLACRPVSYWIGGGRLTERVGNGSWHEHMAVKRWVDLAAFNEAFREAVKRNGAPITDAQLDEWEARAALINRGDAPIYDDKPDSYYLDYGEDGDEDKE